MLKLFIKQCLLFTGPQAVYKLLGVVGWLGIILVSYAAFAIMVYNN